MDRPSDRGPILPPSFRSFIAFDLSQKVRQELRELISSWRQHDGSVRFVDPEQIHLTLKFLGNITEDQKDSVIQTLKMLGEKHATFDMTRARRAQAAAGAEVAAEGERTEEQ